MLGLVYPDYFYAACYQGGEGTSPLPPCLDALITPSLTPSLTLPHAHYLLTLPPLLCPPPPHSLLPTQPPGHPYPAPYPRLPPPPCAVLRRVLWVSEAVQMFSEQYSPHANSHHYTLFIAATNWAKVQMGGNVYRCRH